MSPSYPLDRISPTRRPDKSVAGYQRWRSLLFMHWPAPIDVMRKLVPDELELDLWQGTMWVGVVPFLMEGVRPWWCPQSLAFAFPETNVRTYVVHKGRPGVYFLSLEATSWLAVRAARIGWSLPYFHANISVEGLGDDGGKTAADERPIVRYETRRRGAGTRHFVRYRVGRELGACEPGTLEHFLLERYLLFVQRRGQILCGQVYHTPYPAREAEVLEVEDQLVAAAGLPPVAGLPTVAHFSPGVDVEIFPLRADGQAKRVVRAGT